MKVIHTVVGIAAAALISGAASAASLLTSSAGYTGPTLNLAGYTGYYTFTAGPVSLNGGITYSSTNGGSVLGTGGYGLNGNGSSSTTPIIGTNDPFSVVTLTFATPVSSFGGGFNYAPEQGSDPTISAYDLDGVLIASYDLATLAPISTPGGSDVFQFRGIDGGGVQIKSFTFSGSYLILAGTAGAVPEPASWALMIAGFGLVGAAMRRRAAAIA